MSNYRVIKLMKNHLYPTFQLYAEMRNTRTKPGDGLKLAALITMEWVRLRLGEYIPEEMKQIPPPEEYRSCTDNQLPSMHLNAGFMIDVVSMPEHGVWTLQIAEPDLGPDPGTDSQSREAVPGRVIETNVSFKAEEGRLECGFKIVISDPEGTEQQAEVYRLAIVRRLAAHPDFGLKQISALTEECVRITTVEQLRQLNELTRSKENMLPCVVFTQLAQKDTRTPPKISLESPLPPFPGKLPGMPPIPVPNREAPKKQTAEDPGYDMENFAKYGIGLCRTYLIPAEMLGPFCKQFGKQLEPGETVILEPRAFGGAVRTVPYSPNQSRRKENLDKLRHEMYSYSRNREVPFGSLTFLSATREDLIRKTQAMQNEACAAAERWEEKMARCEEKWRAELKRKDEQYDALKDQLARQQEYQDRLEREKQELREIASQAERRCNLKVQERDEEIAYLRRKLSQPEQHDQIAAWARKYFPDRLVIHKKAEALLEDKSCRAVDAGLICDALDFLATDYWDMRYNQLPGEELRTRCSEKYGRPFDVSRVGSVTIEFTPSQYKIKYFPGRTGKLVESPLDYHLRVGNDPENLLRVYFLHDDDKKLIVVGSLPKHLKAVSIKA